MNESLEENLKKRRDILYYNQLVKTERIKNNEIRQKEHKKSFGAQKVDFLHVPEEWAGLIYAIYIILIPYITGVIFLFLAIARGSYENFKLLDINAFPIVWLIGYEIVAVVMLIWILVFYLKCDEDGDEY